MTQCDHVKHDFTVQSFLVKANKLKQLSNLLHKKGPNTSVERVAFQRRCGR